LLAFSKTHLKNRFLIQDRGRAEFSSVAGFSIDFIILRGIASVAGFRIDFIILRLSVACLSIRLVKKSRSEILEAGYLIVLNHSLSVVGLKDECFSMF